MKQRISLIFAAAELPALLAEHAGPQERIGQEGPLAAPEADR